MCVSLSLSLARSLSLSLVLSLAISRSLPLHPPPNPGMRPTAHHEAESVCADREGGRDAEAVVEVQIPSGATVRSYLYQ